MNNPYKQLSNISPQREKGYRQIANDVLIALNMACFSGPEYQLIYTIINLTWGFQRKSDKITYNDFELCTNLSRSALIRNVSLLEQKRVIYVDRQLVAGRLPLNEYLLNKYYDTWLDKTGSSLYTTSQIKLVAAVKRTSSSPATKLVAHQLPPNSCSKKGKKVRKARARERKLSTIDKKGKAFLKEHGIQEPT